MTLASPENILNVTELCRIAGVSRSGYYNWLKNGQKPSQKEYQDQADFALIQEAYAFRGYDKGVMGIYMRLLHMGIRMNHKKIRRLMRKYGLFCPIRKANPYRRMAKAMQTNSVADNLLKREFKLHGPRKIFLTDITYIPFKDSFLYLSVIMDSFTDEVLSYVLSESLEVDFVLQTVKQLIEKHGISPDSKALIHSDQGCHYTSTSFQEVIADAGLRQSMSRRGNCWDNAPQESFFGHMKEEIHLKSRRWATFSEVKEAIDDWIDYYNNDRYKMGLKNLSPKEFYNYILTGEYPIKMLR